VLAEGWGQTQFYHQQFHVSCVWLHKYSSSIKFTNRWWITPNSSFIQNINDWFLSTRITT